MKKTTLLFIISILYFPTTISFAVPELQSCTINFDSACPDTIGVCSGKARGGNGCVVEGLGNCYSTGAFAYEVAEHESAVFRFKKPVKSLNVFFATEGDGEEPAHMRFFDKNGLQVHGFITSNGDCSGSIMPDSQFISFDKAVHQIKVRAGDVPVFIDTMELNPGSDDPS